MKKVIVFLPIILSGCVQPLKTEADVSEISPFIEFNVNETISVTNAQSSHDEVVVADLDLMAVTGSKFDFTETLIEITEQELVKRKGIITSNNPKKELSLSVDDLSCKKGMFGPSCTTKISLTIGTDYSAVYTAYSENGYTVNDTASHTLAEAMSAMFRDPKVIAYLTDS
ncbi:MULTISPECIES: hypothetical protein [Vibrio]|uniref:hypothetical protein n=1 Tax=Vibrio TaxID=662 RepID=UPI0009388584|nr:MULTISPECIES: hypothetical protein [Vibrio]APP04894.1 hypothetical protein BG259_05845 [Vibrio harveyi]MBE4476289.1 hypothetical protein [Vibrio parahaemolyticus]USD53603.1 hypothetical protein J4N44_09765 [Vibrio sp. SCSIO 43155]